ncbi:sensor histidine kinase [Ectobacillus sp. sgz5001026]|uniref:sensor histidine kinase n=1 Tax=Ectobacillus sp. sgz5001026 TaxID=3242473 RepID=UPI0036D3EF25
MIWKRVVGWLLIVCMGIAMLYMLFANQEKRLISENAKNGILDLTNLPTSIKILPLSGEWKFIPNEFVDPTKFYQDAPNQEVPKEWDNDIQYGSYQILIILPNQFSEVGFRIRNIWSAHTIYVNGDKIYEAGRVGTSKEGMVPKNPAYEVSVKPKSPKLLVTIHVSNFYNARGGIVFPIDFGDALAINKDSQNDLSMERIGIFLFLLFSTFHLTIFLLRTKEVAFFYSGLFLLCSAVYLMTRGETRLLLRKFPNLSFDFYFRLQDSVTFFAVILFLLYILAIMPTFMKKKYLVLLFSPLVIYGVLIVLLPARLLSNLQYVFFFYSDILLLGIFTRLIVIIYKKSWLIAKNEMVILCFMLLFLFMFASSGSFDQLFFSGRNVFNRLGFLGYVISMNVFLSIRLINRTDEAEIAAEQTKRALNKATENEISFLQTQIKPHFLYNALSNIIAFCYTDGERAAHLLSMLSSYLRYLFQFGKEGHSTLLQQELDIIEAYVELEKARFGERFSYSCKIENSIDCSHIEIPSLLIQPLVENAIRHGLFEKTGTGYVQLFISKKDQILYIQVVDDGIGMSENQRKELMEGRMIRSGIGFTNVLRRVRQISKGDFSVHSIEGKGTTIELTIPIKEI